MASACCRTGPRRAARSWAGSCGRRSRRGARARPGPAVKRRTLWASGSRRPRHRYGTPGAPAGTAHRGRCSTATRRRGDSPRLQYVTPPVRDGRTQHPRPSYSANRRARDGRRGGRRRPFLRTGLLPRRDVLHSKTVATYRRDTRTRARSPSPSLPLPIGHNERGQEERHEHDGVEPGRPHRRAPFGGP